MHLETRFGPHKPTLAAYFFFALSNQIRIYELPWCSGLPIILTGLLKQPTRLWASVVPSAVEGFFSVVSAWSTMRNLLQPDSCVYTPAHGYMISVASGCGRGTYLSFPLC